MAEIVESLNQDVPDAIDQIVLTHEQLRALIAYQAQLMGLTYDEAVDLAQRGDLPTTVLGLDTDLLIRMLDG